MTVEEKIKCGKTYLGIELGSTRIKAVLIDDTFTPVAEGSCEWENRLENGYWTYPVEAIHAGIRTCYTALSKNIADCYHTVLKTAGAIGISGMMHGYMAFDKNDRLLVPFRTWRNTTTKAAAKELTEIFQFNIPQRWSIAHLYQAVLDREAHTSQIAHMTTLSGYIHFLLTGKREIGIGDASGMFPIKGGGYDARFLALANARLKEKGLEVDLEEIFPSIKTAGQDGAYLSEAGAAFLDPSGNLQAGIPLCPPEGDAGTGMTATNSVLPKTGNISAGTSIFAMLVLEKPLKKAHSQIDMVTTPDGVPAAMVHCNNCCSELDAWIKIFGEFTALCGCSIEKNTLYEMLYRHALTGDSDCGGVSAYNYLSGEPVTGIESGKPLYFRSVDSRFNLANFFRAQLFSAVAPLKIGMDILFAQEKVKAERFTGHGGLFKIPGVAQKFLADGLDTPVSVMKTAGEGGAWGMALLAAYMVQKTEKCLADFLKEDVFKGMEVSTLMPEREGTMGFKRFMKMYQSGLAIERTAAKI